VRELPPDSALARAELGDQWDWGHLAANVAQLVDLMSYWLHNEYAQWTADPDEVKRRPKRKPPPIPLIPPVAHRPPSVAEQYLTEFAELAETVGVNLDEQPETARERAAKRWVSADEFDALIGAL
jgi:hypothetical protein